jgi:hypothetical protein
MAIHFARPRGALLRSSWGPLVALALLCSSAPVRARASGEVPRFGDSTWVAPNGVTEEDPSADGPRVARPDHERRWETVLRTPFRIVFLPLRFVARGAEEGVGYFGNRVMSPGPKRAAKGIKVGPELDIGGITEVGAGPSITWAGFPSGDSKLHLSGTWSTIDRRRARLSERIGDRQPIGLLLRADYDYKPNLKFYGIGNETPSSNASIFLLENTAVEAALHFGASPLRQLRLVGGYSAMSPRRGYQGGTSPRLEVIFPPGTLPYNHRATQELLYGATGDLAALDSARDPTIGVHARGEFRRAAGLRDGDPDFNQWLIEGRAYAPIFAKRRVLALRGVYTGVGPTGGATEMPFYRLVQTDGPLRFAGYTSHRFLDRQLLLGRIEYRWEVWRSIRAVALYELGEVAPGAKAFTARAARWSYGGGLRYGLSDVSTLRVEVAKSIEGLQANLAIGSGF